MGNSNPLLRWTVRIFTRSSSLSNRSCATSSLGFGRARRRLSHAATPVGVRWPAASACCSKSAKCITLVRRRNPSPWRRSCRAAPRGAAPGGGAVASKFRSSRRSMAATPPTCHVCRHAANRSFHAFHASSSSARRANWLASIPNRSPANAPRIRAAECGLATAHKSRSSSSASRLAKTSSTPTSTLRTPRSAKAATMRRP